MQKKLIALAVAGLVAAPVAMAQSNVTIYGIADAYVAFGSHDDNDMSAVNSGGLSGSRLGFRGREDLGNGLNAVFTFEQGYNVDTGTGLGGNSRQSFVGVSGGFGSITLGRQYAPGYDHIVDAFGNSGILSPVSVLTGGTGASMNAGGGSRWDNSIAYNGSFSGLKVRAIYSMRAIEVAEKESDDDALGLGLDYSNGPIRVTAAYHLIKGANEDQKEWLIGGSYNFGMATLIANYQDAKAVGNVKGNDSDVWQIGLVVPVSEAGNVHVGFGQADVDAVDGKADSWSIAYTHSLSKRTTLYTGYNRTSNDDGLAYGVVAAPAGVTGENSGVFAVGMRHAF